MPNLANATSASIGDGHYLALMSDGTVSAWGQNQFGQAGGDGPASKIPHTVAGVRKAVAVDAGNTHSVALLSDGTVLAWGDNRQQQLGRTSVGGKDTFTGDPLEVPGLLAVTAIDAAGDYTVAVLAGGSVAVWGRPGAAAGPGPPTVLSRISEAAAVAAGARHSSCCTRTAPWQRGRSALLRSNPSNERAAEHQGDRGRR